MKITTFDAINIKTGIGNNKYFEEDENNLSEGYGADAYYITDNDIDKLKQGAILALDSQGEYVIYIKYGVRDIR